MAVVEFRNVSYTIGGREILSNINLQVEAGETMILLGRSGSGKSTALKLTNGLLFPTVGEVLVEGRSTCEWDPIRLKRQIGYVIQDIGLFPHFTVAANVGLVPKLERWAPADIGRRVDDLLGTVGLPAAEYRSRYPRQLSGGQRQRVGVARALAADPPLLLFDEPFGALDPVTRFELQQEFLTVRQKLNKTAVFVTHDVREAIRLGTRIALLAGGKLNVVTTPDEFHTARTPEAQAFLASL
jgi:osmoprotectant transport system ATP-binding protein